ncbi:NAD-dependent epimerase/dehydratase family protein [Gloeothece verrucosa]|uniref:NAD-dependent epimerase/dehydratase n=1 Tax=Gloeothece verrucosa (strain PCC 7822) TaxID=497965 RepID=E0UL78_GLOV7|nr:NAD(P)-dependent oxidoreductase [Gloeothece verrucosa]ADN17708.1 NAD-dependent epimerase/dehydratase [Gloeothece verrucosa PCC 7822]
MNSTNKTILITGVAGFIGLRAAQFALARGMKVRGLQSSKTKAEIAEKLGVDVVIGSVNDPIAAEKACQGVDIVLHTAAKVKEGGSLEDFREVNVNGTVVMAQAALNSGVKQFIHLSSVMVYGFNYPKWVTEEGPLCGENNPYCQTKIEAEQALMELNSPGKFDVVIIRAGDVYGPRGGAWVLQPLQLMHKRLFVLADQGRGTMNHVYIDNLLDGIFLTIDKECSGQIFNITDGKSTSWQEYFSYLAEIKGNYHLFSLPSNLLKIIISFRNFAQIIAGKKPDFLPSAVDFMTRPYPYSIEKASKELGFAPKVSLKEGMSYTKEWLYRENLI